MRLSGQDARRGTFSHRHATLYDTRRAPATRRSQHLGPRRSRSSTARSPRRACSASSTATRSTAPTRLVIWEAQFGDFANGAQVIIDQFIVSGEDKWNRLSGLVLLLPHGYEGQGPEHSSARIERFLQLAAEDNIQVMQPHDAGAALPRAAPAGAARKWRKPLVVFTPKSLLRHPKAVSTVDDLATGAFQKVIGDPVVEPKAAKRVLVCSGKVYYDLLDAREKKGRADVAILRLEQLYPLDAGACYFLSACFFPNLKRPYQIVSRPAAASPATGSKASHDLEQQRLLDEAFG
jgi:2-oxoglutarate dehydrogenase E1 component